MILSKLELYNFRQFKAKEGRPGFSVTFHKGLNALIGENDSGKTAIIDAIKLVLLTQSNEYIHATDEDFYIDENGHAENEFQISITLSDFSEEEAKNFIEYLSFEIGDNGIPQYYLRLYYRAWKEKNRIFSELRAGNLQTGIALEPKARELLKSVYLKPLRDAEHEMHSGRNSRISQILISHTLFKDKEKNKLVDILKEANENIKTYFTKEDGKVILDNICKTLEEFSAQGISGQAEIATSDMKLKAILESLSLLSPEIHPGLGESNLLFIAAELLLLNHDDTGGLKLALIEELEAHLHPQAQLRLIDFLQKEYRDTGVQIIISTHSTALASKINLKNIVLIKNGSGYDLAPGNTQLLRGDYLFLQRFLDATKSNMFFARGIIMIEGDAENLVIPVIADIIGYPLEKWGISLVNVGSTAFLRYSRIFARADGSSMKLPVSIITDCDIKPYDNKKKKFTPQNTETTEAIKNKETKYSLGDIKAFITPRWTFEYTLALNTLKEEFHKAIYCAKKIKNSDKYTLTSEKMVEVEDAVQKDTEKWEKEALPANKRAFEMYGLMQDEDGTSSLKAITAQCFAALLHLSFIDTPDGFTAENDMFDLDMLEWTVNKKKKEELKNQIEHDRYLKYLVDAIKHAAGCKEENQ